MDPELLFQKYYDKALRFLSFRPRSEKELRDNLTRKKAPAEIIEKIIMVLREQRFLNDTEFAAWWVRQRATFRPKGHRVIRLELRQKGIQPDLIDHAMAEIEHDETVPTDSEAAKKLVEKRMSKYKDLPRHELYQKLGAFLARRGFDWDTIKTSIDDVLKKQYNRG